jgi:diadenosine tetraphosphate (Ap4A) HIT family hydrolase
MGDTLGFSLDARLVADTIACGRLPLSRLLLMNDARYPWLILVPERPQVRELFELSPADRATLIEEIAAIGAMLARICTAYKINVAALGNVVAQLHIHIVGRFTGDPAWPGPVWGRLPPLPYSAAAAEAMIARVRSALAAGPLPFSPAADG